METTAIEGFRLSPQQRWLWHLREEAGGASDPYRAGAILRRAGALDRQVLERAVGVVVQRHEILRTGFVTLAGMSLPLQVVRPEDAPRIQPLDLLDLPADDRGAMARSLFAELREGAVRSGERGRSCACGRSASLRTSTCSLADLSALCVDGVALDVLLSEVAYCYEALAAGRTPELAEPAQYVDLSEWQNELLESAETGTGRDHWRKLELPSPDPDLSFLSFDAPGAAFEPRSVAFELPAGLSGVPLTASLPDCPSEVFLLAAWQVFLWRLGGERDLVVATAFDGRKYEKIAHALGTFVKDLPIPCRFDSGQRFESALGETLAAWRAAHKWQEYFVPERSFPLAFEHGEREAHPAAGTARGPVFTLLRQEVCLDRFELKLACFRSAGEWSGEIHYNAAWITGARAAQIAARFSALLQAALRSPGTLLGDLEILSGAEREEVLRGFNDSAVELPIDSCLHDLVAEAAARSPERTAVVFAEHSLSFAELDAAANRLARHLRELGVGPEVRVAVLADRSLDVIVALLGVLKAGGAYLPLDPGYPRERLAFMVEDARPQVLITELRFAALLSPHSLATVLLDDDAARIAGRSSAPLASGALPANLAYVIYTSGSTGRPKGVMVPHRAILQPPAALDAAQEGAAGRRGPGGAGRRR